MRLYACLGLVGILLGCASRAVRMPAPSPSASTPLPPPPDLALERNAMPDKSPVLRPDPGSYFDLRPGWRLRVTTPVLKPGGHQLLVMDWQDGGKTVTAFAGEDVDGYETSYYAIEPRAGGGVRIEFVSAEVTKLSGKVPQPAPLVPLFRLPPMARFVRLIYLQRVSQSDHDAALVAADEVAILDRLTHAVETNKASCKSDSRSYCSWIPAGVGVRPEKLGL